MRRGFGIALFVSVFVLITAPAAWAAKPIEHSVDKFDETFSEELCGIAVDGHVKSRTNFLVFEDGIQDVSSGVVTWTNEDGDWLQLRFAGRVRVIEVVNNGILTITEIHSGVQERLRSNEGTTAAFDRGRVIFEIVIDLHDPDDPEDDEFISFETVFVAGPHPELESDFSLFCEVVMDVLG